MADPQQRQMNVYARFIEDDPREETAPPAKPAPRTGAARTAKTAVRHAKPGVKKRGALPK